MKTAAYFLLSLMALGLASAQTPAPMVVPAEPAPNVSAAPIVKSIPPAAAPAGNALQIMQALKATNDDLLNKQTATLQRLDELQKAADQLKIYSKRG